MATVDYETVRLNDLNTAEKKIAGTADHKLN